MDKLAAQDEASPAEGSLAQDLPPEVVTENTSNKPSKTKEMRVSDAINERKFEVCRILLSAAAVKALDAMSSATSGLRWRAPNPDRAPGLFAGLGEVQPAGKNGDPAPPLCGNGEGHLWKVVGGKKGVPIIVRTSDSESSRQMALRLAVGAIVQQQDIAGNRMFYRRIRGSGPDFGWVSLQDKNGDYVFKKIPRV